MKFLVSVIMNCYNGEKYLKTSIKSILNQSYKNLELIFWDNCSTDNSLSILRSFKDKRIKYFRSKSFLGLYEARNLAIKKAKGKFISFLDVDDIWVKNKIQKQYDLYRKSKQKINFIYSNCFFLQENEKKLFSKHVLPEGKITQYLLNNYIIGLPTIFVKKNILLKEKFNPKYNIIGDFDFIIRISKKINFNCVQEPLAYYRIHKNNYSAKNLKQYIFEVDYWLKKNKINLNKQGYKTINQSLFLFKLKLKKILINFQYLNNILGRIVQW